MRILLAGAALVVGLVTGQVSATQYPVTHRQQMPVPAWMTHPCVNEDSVNCYYDAQKRGNHKGVSFYVRQIPHTGKRHPLVCQLRVNHVRYDQCWRYNGGGM